MALLDDGTCVSQGAMDLLLLLEESADVSQGAIAVLFVRL
jgi:hypothetical protein